MEGERHARQDREGCAARTQYRSGDPERHPGDVSYRLRLVPWVFPFRLAKACWHFNLQWTLLMSDLESD